MFGNTDANIYTHTPSSINTRKIINFHEVRIYYSILRLDLDTLEGQTEDQSKCF